MANVYVQYNKASATGTFCT